MHRLSLRNLVPQPGGSPNVTDEPPTPMSPTTEDGASTAASSITGAEQACRVRNGSWAGLLTCPSNCVCPAPLPVNSEAATQTPAEDIEAQNAAKLEVCHSGSLSHCAAFVPLTEAAEQTRCLHAPPALQAKRKKRLQARTYIVKELLATERNYVHALQTVIDVWAPLRPT